MSTQLMDTPTVESESSPVFVDSTGRRARRAKRAAWTLAACCVAYLAVFGVSLAAGPVNPMVPVGRFPELTPPTAEAAPVATPSSTSRKAAARTRPTAVAPTPVVAPPRSTPVAPTPTPAPTAPTTSGPPSPTSSPAPTTSAPTSSAEPIDPPTSEPAPTSTGTADPPEETEAQAADPAGGTTPGGAA